MAFDPNTARPINSSIGFKIPPEVQMERDRAAALLRQGEAQAAPGEDPALAGARAYKASFSPGQYEKISIVNNKFDPSTAKPFDPGTAKLVSQEPQKAPQQTFLDVLKGLGPEALAIIQGPTGLAGYGVNKAMENFGPETANKLGGAVTDVTGSPFAGMMANVGLQGIGMGIGGGAGKTVGNTLKGGAERLMQSAIKPSKEELLKGDGLKAVRTMLGEGINVTPGGVEKLQRMIDAVNQKITAAIAASPATVNKFDVANATQAAIDKFRRQVNPKSDLKTIFSGIDEFLNSVPENMRVQLAQELKTGTYRALGSKAYGELKGAESEVQKQLARGLKEEIAKVVPGIDKLNKTESELLNAHTQALTRVLMHGNKDTVGLGWLIMHPSHLLGWAADRSPLIKSLIARGMYSGGGDLSTAVGAGIPGSYSLIKENQRENQ
jgi:hypothetical protein